VELLGVARSGLLKQPFTACVEAVDQDRYYHHRKMLFETGVPQLPCGLRMRRQDGRVLNVYLKAIITHYDAGEAVYRLAVIECGQDKLAESPLGVQ
jgi:hypothetical protein